MQIPVLIEPIAGDGYRARGVEPFALTVEGATRDEVLRKLRESIQRRLVGGVELISLEVPTTENPWLRVEGIYKDDPLFEEWQQAIAEYRKQVDEDPNAR